MKFLRRERGVDTIWNTHQEKGFQRNRLLKVKKRYIVVTQSFPLKGRSDGLNNQRGAGLIMHWMLRREETPHVFAKKIDASLDVSFKICALIVVC